MSYQPIDLSYSCPMQCKGSSCLDLSKDYIDVLSCKASLIYQTICLVSKLIEMIKRPLTMISLMHFSASNVIAKEHSPIVSRSLTPFSSPDPVTSIVLTPVRVLRPAQSSSDLENKLPKDLQSEA